MLRETLTNDPWVNYLYCIA